MSVGQGISVPPCITSRDNQGTSNRSSSRWSCRTSSRSSSSSTSGCRHQYRSLVNMASSAALLFRPRQVAFCCCFVVTSGLEACWVLLPTPNWSVTCPWPSAQSLKAPTQASILHIFLWWISWPACIAYWDSPPEPEGGKARRPHITLKHSHTIHKQKSVK